MLFNFDFCLLALSTLCLYSLMTIVSAKTSKHHSKQIKMNVYFEPQDLESTTFFKEQLMPLMENGLIEKIDLKLIPTGRATCDASHQEYECKCTQGDVECELMHLMSCALHDYRNHAKALDLIGCIQGQTNFDSAYEECVRKLPTRDAKWFAKCPHEFRGKYLSWMNTLRTKAIGFELPLVPTVTLNNELNLEATFGLRTQICKLLAGQNVEAC